LKDVSPRLATMRNTSIPMPGVSGMMSGPPAAGGLEASPGAVTIASIVDEVTVLPTKTRPKKLRMIGSDGKTYIYLVKVSVHPGFLGTSVLERTCIHSLWVTTHYGQQGPGS
jgi:hypothetical protein